MRSAALQVWYGSGQVCCHIVISGFFFFLQRVLFMSFLLPVSERSFWATYVPVFHSLVADGDRFCRMV
jgi:hypothetical protein